MPTSSAQVRSLPPGAQLPRGEVNVGLRAEPSAGRAILWLSALVLLPRALLLPFAEPLYGDAAARIELALAWAQAPHWMLGFGDGARQFGPLHLYLVGLAGGGASAPHLAAAAVSLISGVATVPPLYLLTRRCFDHRAGVLAALGLGAWGLHLQLSTTAASEALFLLLLTASLWQFGAGHQDNRVAPLALSGVLLQLAMATRYEAWFLAPLLCVLLFFRDRDRLAGVTRALFYALLCAPFPLLWLHGNELLHGDMLFPARFIDAYHHDYVRRELAAWGELSFRAQSLVFWPASALLSLTPLVALFGMAGMAAAWRARPQVRWLIWTAVVPAAYFTFRAAVLLDFAPLSRFTASQQLLLLPFVAAGYDQVARGTTPARARAWAASAVLLALLVPLALGAATWRRDGKLWDWVRPLSPVTTNTAEVRELSAWLRGWRAPQGQVLLDAPAGYADVQIAFLSRQPPEVLIRARWEDWRARLAGPPEVIVTSGRGALWRSGALVRDGAGLRFEGMAYAPLPGAPDGVYRRR